MSQNVTFMFILTLTYVLMDNFLSLFFSRLETFLRKEKASGQKRGNFRKQVIQRSLILLAEKISVQM